MVGRKRRHFKPSGSVAMHWSAATDHDNSARLNDVDRWLPPGFFLMTDPAIGSLATSEEVT